MPAAPPLGPTRRLAATLLTGSLLLGGLLAMPTPASAAGTTAVRVNQVGYLPDGPKRATVVTTAAQPLTWQLRDTSGAAVASGTAVPRGADTPPGSPSRWPTSPRTVAPARVTSLPWTAV